MQDAMDDNDLPGSNLPSTLTPRAQQLAQTDPRMQALSTLVRNVEAELGEKEVDLLEYWRVIVKRKWTVIGAFVMGVMNNGMSILGIGIDYQQVIKGLVLLAAVFFDVHSRARR